MKFKRFLVIFGIICLVAVIVLSWGCQNQPTAPQTGEMGIGGTSGKVRYTELPLRLRARSTDGQGKVRLICNSKNCAEWTLGTSMGDHRVSLWSSRGNLRVEFFNDASGRDVQVDYLSVNGDYRQAESQYTNTAVWQNGSCGGHNSEWMHCNGYIDFGDTGDGGGGSSTTTTTTSGGGGGGTKYITSTIRVNGGTYDGGGQRIIAQGMGDGSQNENQDPIFRLENATLRNVRIAAPGCDGVHCYGNCRVENVVWEDVGEDALTIKGQGSTTVSGGSARYAADKVFQLNQPCTFRVENFTCTDFGCFIRQNGGTSFKCTIYLNGVTLRNGDYGVRTDASSTQIYYRNLSTSNVKQMWRVPNQSSQVHTY